MILFRGVFLSGQIYGLSVHNISLVVVKDKGRVFVKTATEERGGRTEWHLVFSESCL